MEHTLQFFEYGHLPLHLQMVSRPFCDLANQVVHELPRNPERTEALQIYIAVVRAFAAAFAAVPHV